MVTYCIRKYENTWTRRRGEKELYGFLKDYELKGREGRGIIYIHSTVTMKKKKRNKF